MFKLSLYLLTNVIAYAFALHNFLPINEAAPKKNIYTNFVPPSAERFFAAGAPLSTKAAASAPSLLPATGNAPYLGPYAAYQPQYTPFPYKQYPTPYYPGVFYPPVQQFVYPSAVGPSPVVYVPRYPVPAESGNEQGGSSGSAGGWGNYFPSNWQSWGSNWGSYFPSWPGSGGSESAEGGTPSTSAEGSSSQAGASPASSSNRAKPEKIEAIAPTPAPAPAPSQDSTKLDSDDKNAVTVELPEQQYVLLGQPQFYGQLAAFPADRDPTTLNGAAKGAVSSFLFYKDQSQQVVPQRFDDISSVPGSASLAYQRFLLLSKQRSEDGPKLTNKSESLASTSVTPSSSSSANTRNEIPPQPSSTNSTSAAADSAAIASQSPPTKLSGSSST